MRAKTLGLAIFALMSSTSAWAGGLQWTVSESSGPVNIMHAGVSKIVARGGALAVGDVVATGAKGRAVLVRGKEYLVVSPNSRISIADPAQSGGFIQIVQDWGSAIFKIEKKTEKHFAVKTPYLAAVVKGTTFNVTVDDKGARVQVTEGRVEVATPDGKAMSMVMPGEVGLVSAFDTLRLRVQGIEGRVIDSPQRGAPSVGANGADTEPSAPEKVAETEAETKTQDVAAAESAQPETETRRPATDQSGSNSADNELHSGSGQGDSSRITAAIGEGEVKLDQVTAGMVSGNSSLISTAKPMQVAVAAVLGAPTTAPMPTSAGTAMAEEIPEEGAGSGDEQAESMPPVESDAADTSANSSDSDSHDGDSGSSGSSNSGSSGSSNSGSSGSSNSGSSGSNNSGTGSGNVAIAQATNSSGGKTVTVTSTGNDGQNKTYVFTLPIPKPPTGR